MPRRSRRPRRAVGAVLATVAFCAAAVVAPAAAVTTTAAAAATTAAAAAPNTSRVVCVTGISGYVASVLGQHLLSRGYTVHGTVRDLERYSAQQEFADIKLFQAELLDDGDGGDGETAGGAFDAAFADCHVVMHTASPFFRNVEDPRRDLIAPALRGTLNVLRAAARAPLVDTVVLTSSTAAVGPMQLPKNRKPASVPIDESDWTTDTTLENAPYRLSKRVAEKAAWQFMDSLQQKHEAAGANAGKPPPKLAVMNPAFVLGSLAIPRVAGESTWFMKGMLEGAQREKGASNSACFGVVDVHDLADAHIAAMEKIDEAAGKRFVLTSSKAVSQLEVAGFLRSEPRLADFHGGLPTRFEGGTAPFCASYDHSRAERVLGISFKPPRQTVVEMALDLVERELVTAPEQQKEL